MYLIFKIEDADDIYDVVTEEDYNAIIQKRLRNDDFIEDDDGLGYVDYGQEEDWDEPSHEYDDEDEENIDNETVGRKSSGITYYESNIIFYYLSLFFFLRKGLYYWRNLISHILSYILLLSFFHILLFFFQGSKRRRMNDPMKGKSKPQTRISSLFTKMVSHNSNKKVGNYNMKCIS